MSDTSQGNGWWQASDGKWYAPEQHPDYVAPTEPPAAAAADVPAAAEEPAAEVPTAEAPTTEAPTTEAPTTEAPADVSPAMVPPGDIPAPPMEPPAPDATQAFAAPPPGDVPPVPPIMPPPIGLPPTGPPADGGGKSKKPLVIALVIIAVIALAGAAFALTRDDDKSVATKSDSSGKSDSTDSSSSKTTTTKKPTTTTEPAAKAAKFTIVTGGSSSTDGSGNFYAMAGATLTNVDGKLAVYNVKVVFNVLDAGGTVIDTETTTVDYIAPGATVFAAPSGFSVNTDVANVEVKAVGDLKVDKGYAGADYTSLQGISLTVVDAALVPDPYSPSITVHVSNPSTQTADYGQLTCLLYAGTTIVGGTTTYLDTVVPGGTVQADAYLDFIPAGADGVQCQAVA